MHILQQTEPKVDLNHPFSSESNKQIFWLFLVWNNRCWKQNPKRCTFLYCSVTFSKLDLEWTPTALFARGKNNNNKNVITWPFFTRLRKVTHSFTQILGWLCHYGAFILEKSYCLKVCSSFPLLPSHSRGTAHFLLIFDCRSKWCIQTGTAVLKKSFLIRWNWAL